MEDNRHTPDRPQSTLLQPVFELIQGGDPDQICFKYGISRQQLEQMLAQHQASSRRTALEDAFTVTQTGRNDPCPCGSGKKYKKCCLPGHEEARKTIPPDQLMKMKEREKIKEKLEKDVQKGFDLVLSAEFERAARYAGKMLESYPEDDRFHDLAMAAKMGLGEYGDAFDIARERWKTSVEEKRFYGDNSYYKREGADRGRHVHFYSPTTWLEKFWISQRARTWRDIYPAYPDSELSRIAGKLKAANDLKRFPAKQEEGFESRRRELAPVLLELESRGPSAALPHLLPLAYTFTWASLFIPGLLQAWDTDECLRLTAELSMFRYPYFSQNCLVNLEKNGERAVPVIEAVLAENPAYDELKVGLLAVLGNVPTQKSFEILTAYTQNESRYITAYACDALLQHKNDAAIPYIEKAKERLGAVDKIAGAMREIAGAAK